MATQSKAKSTYGGKREGAGRPIEWEKKYNALLKEHEALKLSIQQAEIEATANCETSLDFLLAIMNCPKLPLDKRMRAAITAAQYQHTKKGKKGKKEEALDNARGSVEGGSSRLRPSAPPQLKKVA